MRTRLKNAADIESCTENETSPLNDNSNIAERMEEDSAELGLSNSVSSSIDDSLSPPTETPRYALRTRTSCTKKPTKLDDEQSYGPRNRSPSTERACSPSITFSDDQEDEDEEYDEEEDSPPPRSPRATRPSPSSSEGSSEVCRACQETFPSMCALSKHVKQDHKDDPGPFFDCDQCDKKYRTYAPLNFHKLNKHGGKVKNGIGKNTKGPFEHCPICDAPFKGKTRLSIHLYIEHKGEKVKPFECDLCGLKFRMVEWMTKHRQKHFDTEVRPFSCGYEKCCLSFDSHDGLRSHERMHGGLTEATMASRPVDRPCEHCAQRFKTSEQLKWHIKEAHPEVTVELFECDVCFIPFTNRKTLYNHRKKHKSDAQDPAVYPFHCDICELRFKQYRGLSGHQNKQHGGLTEAAHAQKVTIANSFTCPLCKEYFPGNFSLSEHIATDHPDSKGLLFICDMCNKYFDTDIAFDRHRLAVHKIYKCGPRGKRSKDPADLLFTCDICNKSFEKDSLLSMHQVKMHKIYKRGPLANPRKKRSKQPTGYGDWKEEHKVETTSDQGPLENHPLFDNGLGEEEMKEEAAVEGNPPKKKKMKKKKKAVPEHPEGVKEEEEEQWVPEPTGNRMQKKQPVKWADISEEHDYARNVPRDWDAWASGLLKKRPLQYCRERRESMVE